MNLNVRRGIFLPAAAALGGLLLFALRGLPPVGKYVGPYGDVLNAVSVPKRHITDVVTAVNFDYRGFDTLGEEFILFISVVGASLLLRRQKDEEEGSPEDRKPKRQRPSSSDAVRILSIGLIGPLVLFGLYIVTHGQLTPGGGFQGGVILATAPLLVYLAGEFERFRNIAGHSLVEVAEAIGAGGYVVIGLVGLCKGGAFLQNVLPLGQKGDVFCGGTVPLINLTVGLEVSAGFLLLLIAYLEEMLGHKEL